MPPKLPSSAAAVAGAFGLTERQARQHELPADLFAVELPGSGRENPALVPRRVEGVTECPRNCRARLLLWRESDVQMQRGIATRHSPLKVPRAGRVVEADRVGLGGCNGDEHRRQRGRMQRSFARMGSASSSALFSRHLLPPLGVHGFFPCGPSSSTTSSLPASGRDFNPCLRHGRGISVKPDSLSAVAGPRLAQAAPWGGERKEVSRNPNSNASFVSVGYPMPSRRGEPTDRAAMVAARKETGPAQPRR